MKTISRTTKVVSVSLPAATATKLEKARKKWGQSRSAFISALIDKNAEDESWARMYKWGEETRRKFNITSEDDIDRILHEA